MDKQFKLEHGFKKIEKELPDFSRHKATFMVSWPLEPHIWSNPKKTQEGIIKIAQQISEFEPVCLLTPPDKVADVKKQCSSSIEVWPVNYRYTYIRDIGPTFVLNENGEKIAINWNFNCWGIQSPESDKINLLPKELQQYFIKYFLKYFLIQDNVLQDALSERFNLPNIKAPFILEPGGIDVDGEKTLLSTESVLLNKNRNPGYTKDKVHDVLSKYLGIEKIIWLKEGIVGDSTDGHIDNIARFAKPGCIITETYSDRNDPNYVLSEKNTDIIKNSRDARGRKFDIVSITQPPPRYRTFLLQKIRLTLSYLNFIFVNDGLFVPAFGADGKKTDEDVRVKLQELFPERKVISFDGMVLIEGGGNLHCATLHEPV